MNNSTKKPVKSPRSNSPDDKSRPHTVKPATSTSIVSEELENTLHEAFVEARERRHEFVTVEHLLFKLVDAEGPKTTLLACDANIDELKSRLSVFIDQHTPVTEEPDEVDSQPTLGFQRVIQRAILHVQSEKRSGQVTSNDVLVAIFGEQDSHAKHYLHQQGVTKLDVVNFLTHGISKSETVKAKPQSASEFAARSDIYRQFDSLFSEVFRPQGEEGQKPKTQAKLFISYSHVDTPCLERLLVHLKPLERSNTVVCWSDKRIRTGDKWRLELERNLSESVIAILLVSADFLASDFIVNNELPPLLIKADSNGLRILPVILKPCGFRRDPVLSTFQAANDPAAPLLGMTEMAQESLYDKIAEEVAKEISIRRTY